MHELEYAIWEINKENQAGHRKFAEKQRLAQAMVERELPASNRQAKLLVLVFAVLGAILWVLVAL